MARIKRPEKIIPSESLALRSQYFLCDSCGATIKVILNIEDGHVSNVRCLNCKRLYYITTKIPEYNFYVSPIKKCQKCGDEDFTVLDGLCFNCRKKSERSKNNEKHNQK